MLTLASPLRTVARKCFNQLQVDTFAPSLVCRWFDRQDASTFILKPKWKSLFDGLPEFDLSGPSKRAVLSSKETQMTFPTHFRQLLEIMRIHGEAQWIRQDDDLPVLKLVASIKVLCKRHFNQTPGQYLAKSFYERWFDCLGVYTYKLKPGREVYFRDIPTFGVRPNAPLQAIAVSPRAHDSGKKPKICQAVAENSITFDGLEILSSAMNRVDEVDLMPVDSDSSKEDELSAEEFPQPAAIRHRKRPRKPQVVAMSIPQFQS